MFRKQLMSNILVEEMIRIDEVNDMDLNNFAQTHKEELGLSTDPGEISPDALASIKPQAEKLYREQKQKELITQFQGEVSKRHEVKVFQEAFSEGAK
ncbi:MAG: hypothetical protein HQL32_08205 [Planctomycetes bacterium]|nr:hypothetical protein [Planctomycetota bacterium]